MSLPKRVSLWTVVDVFDWVKEQYPYQKSVFQLAIFKHDISGRALLRMGEHQLERMGVEVEHLQEILLDILLLRVQEELENLNDIFSECFSS
ncbi:sterile alpha motif domain-containing protein 12 [Salmo salar]|uniref:Sterile alpha motif domain-containing protein 12 n=1 Tax=Salmo salar TaxID=8030 RepID=A0A1S3MA19_SALSA|nr:sterile alpha motif domain-containing protein 12 [Salmo salar]XP_029589579.1 sterile alpha motif domain-containing protein 12-like [Salmo trutta]|eukprot:XP_013999930.1 PREDICTED: sterile alpha motif domain-containing protein 12-like [Salmo salar]